MAYGDLRRLTDKISDVFFPPRCPGCADVVAINAIDAFCPECRAKWEKHKKENCYRCGQPIDRCWCGVRLDKDGYITNEYHLVQYDKMADTVIKNLLYNMKNYNRDLVFNTIGKDMYNELYLRF